MGEAVAGAQKTYVCGVRSPWLAGVGSRDKRCNGLLLRASLTSGALLYGGSGFHHKHPVFQAPPLLPSLQDVSSQPTAVICLGLLSKPRISARSSFLHWWTCL